MCGRLVRFQEASLIVAPSLALVCRLLHEEGFEMSERTRRESLLLGLIAGAIIAIGIIVPVIAMNI